MSVEVPMVEPLSAAETASDVFPFILAADGTQRLMTSEERELYIAGFRRGHAIAMLESSDALWDGLALLAVVAFIAWQAWRAWGPVKADAPTT